MIYDWKKIAVPSRASLREALAVIDRGTMQIALVSDDDCHLQGTVTDGDIRRALLRGHSLDTCVAECMNPNPITGLIDEDHSSWQRTMRLHTLRHLPLLDAHACIVGLVRFEPPQDPVRDNPVVLMVGGLGTRLRPLTQNHPKPLLEVGTKPILETIIENYAAHGLRRFFLCINYKGEMIKNYFGDGSAWDVEIQYVEEPQRLGTAGALSLLPQRPEQPFFVMNGDLLTKVDFVRLLHFHEKQQASATMCVREYVHQVPYGVVQLDGYSVTDLIEKPTQREYVNAGIYVLEPRVLDLVPKDRHIDMTEVLNRMLQNQLKVSSFPLREYWIDIGRSNEYEQAGADYEEVFQ